MRFRALLLAVVVASSTLVAISPGVAASSETKESACAKDPVGDEHASWDDADFDPVDITRICYRYTPDALVLEMSVVKPLDPLEAPVWQEGGSLYFSIYAAWSEDPYASDLEVMYYVWDGEIVVRVRPINFADGKDWACYGTGSTTSSGYAAHVPWDCVRIDGELNFMHWVITLGEQRYNDTHAEGLCCGPTPPEPPPSRPAVKIRSADSACPPGEVPEDGLTDADGSVHEGAIDCTMWWGVTTRTSAGRFSPTGTVSRGLMAEWIARFLDRTGGQLPESADDQFSDVASSPYRDNINRIGAAKVVGGYPDGTFRPNEPVTRAQMATFVASAHRFASGQVLGTTETDWFHDDETSVHEESINRIASVGVAGGTSQGVYSPGADITRGQMASFLARLLDVAVDDGRATPPS